MATLPRPLPKDQPKDIRGLYDTLKQIAERHDSLVDFACGESVNYSGRARAYPLLYLELPFSISTEGSQGKGYLERYDVTISVADRMPSENAELDLINALSRVKQLLVHVHTLLDAQVVASSLRVLTYQDAGADKLVVARGQFTVTMHRADAPQDAAKSSHA